VTVFQESVPITCPACRILTSNISGGVTPKVSGLNHCLISRDIPQGLLSVAGPLSCSVVRSIANHFVLTSRGYNLAVTLDAIK
jgi:hypothetical protein